MCAQRCRLQCPTEQTTMEVITSTAAGMGTGAMAGVASGAAAARADYYDTHHFVDKRFFRPRNKGETNADEERKQSTEHNAG